MKKALKLLTICFVLSLAVSTPVLAAKKDTRYVYPNYSDKVCILADKDEILKILSVKKNKLFLTENINGTLQKRLIKTFPKSSYISIVGITKKGTFYIDVITKNDDSYLYKATFKKPKLRRFGPKNAICAFGIWPRGFISFNGFL